MRPCRLRSTASAAICPTNSERAGSRTGVERHAKSPPKAEPTVKRQAPPVTGRHPPHQTRSASNQDG